MRTTAQYIQANLDSRNLEDKLCPSRPLKNDSDLSDEAILKGDKISSDYNVLVHNLKKEVEASGKPVPLLAHVYYHWAHHADVLRQFFYTCHEQAMDDVAIDEATTYLDKTMAYSCMALTQIELCAKLYITKELDAATGDFEMIGNDRREYHKMHSYLLKKQGVLESAKAKVDRIISQVYAEASNENNDTDSADSVESIQLLLSVSDTVPAILPEDAVEEPEKPMPPKKRFKHMAGAGESIHGMFNTPYGLSPNLGMTRVQIKDETADQGAVFK